SLSPEDQEAIMSVSGAALAELAGTSQDAEEIKAKEQMAADGVVFNEADEAFLSAVRDRLEGLEADWIEQADGLGVDGEAALARMREVVSGVEN
ncbi:MAG: ABC transporter substrate-binding protein, partial [Oricola sp.]|nr:ABC transporter substrate-binding protein [Oricola sp.]